MSGQDKRNKWGDGAYASYPDPMSATAGTFASTVHWPRAALSKATKARPMRRGGRKGKRRATGMGV